MSSKAVTALISALEEAENRQLRAEGTYASKEYDYNNAKADLEVANQDVIDLEAALEVLRGVEP